VRVSRGTIDRLDAKDDAIDDWHEHSLPTFSLDGDQRAILQKWQRKFGRILYEEDSRLAA
jgi:hypothetical protein